jgi:hypothetical protein
MSYAPEIFVENHWTRNGLRFATFAEAEERASDLYSRWTMAAGFRATEADEPVNYRLVDGELEAVS